METAPVGPTTSSWPSNSVAVVGEAVLNISASINTKPSAPIVYGTPLAKPVMDENVELAVDEVEVPGRIACVIGPTDVAGVTELSTDRKLVGAGAPTVISVVGTVLIEIGSISIEDQNVNSLARVRWTWSIAKRRTYVGVVLLPSPTGRKTGAGGAEGAGVIELGVRGSMGMKADGLGAKARVLDVAAAPPTGRKSPGAGAPVMLGAASPVVFCLLTSLASMIALTSADALFCKVATMPSALCAGRCRHAYSTNAMRPRVARRRQSNEGIRVIDG